MRGAALLAALLSIALPQAARAATPMSYLQSFSRAGQAVTPLTWGLLALSIFVIVVISALVLVGTLLRRSRNNTPAAGAPIVRAGSGLSWISIGVGLSTIALLATMVWTVATMAAITGPETAPITVEVRGHQWWWEFRYLSADSSRIFTTANEFHIPVGQSVRFRLIGADVIHSFWIPSLAGKTDVIPGQTNTMTLEANRPGIYRGQCTEYCGEQHAHMALIAYADTPGEFQAWWDGQLKPAPAPASDDEREGENRFVLRCGACHAIRGTPAGGRLGPDLSHLMSRSTLAAGTLPNTIAYLSGWIANPQTVKPGAEMPNLDLSGPELASIRDFLRQQK